MDKRKETIGRKEGTRGKIKKMKEKKEEVESGGRIPMARR